MESEKSRFSDLQNEFMVAEGERMVEGIVRESGMDMDTLLCLTWRTNKDLLDSTGNSSQYSVVTYMQEESEKERIHVYV